MMSILTGVFRQLLSMALTALPVMAVVLLVRRLLRGIPKKYSCWLWLVVAVRLVCPWSLREAGWSLFNLEPVRQAVEAVGSDASTGMVYQPYTAPGQGAAALPELPAMPLQPVRPVGEEVYHALSFGERALGIGTVIWLAGLTAMLAYGLWSVLRLRRSVATAILRDTNIWECDTIDTPFVLGLLRPRVYLPFRLDDRQRTYLLAHERAHIRRLDHWTKPLAFLILAAYWWDPAVWLCWLLLCRDLEMRCDELALEELGTAAKAGYSAALVEFATERRFPAAPAFGERDAARRVKNVLNWRRETPRMLFLAFTAGLLVVLLCCFNAQGSGAWLKNQGHEQVGSRSGTNFSYSIPGDIHSALLYEEVYEYGVLTSREFRWAGDAGTEALPQRGEFQLSAYMLDGFREMQWGVTVDGVVRYLESAVPEDDYRGFSWSAIGDTGRSRQELGTDTAIAVATPTKGWTRVFQGMADIEKGPGSVYLQDTATAAVLRLMLSTRDAESLRAAFEAQKDDLAQRLFDGRTQSVENETAVEDLLGLLNVPRLGGYTWKLLTEESGKTLQIDFSDLMEDTDEDGTCRRVDGQMWDCSALLLALVGDVEQVNWSYPGKSREETVHITVYADRNWVDSCAESLRYQGIKDLGASAGGVRDLLWYLDWDGVRTAEELFVCGTGGSPVDLGSMLLSLEKEEGSRLWGPWRPGYVAMQNSDEGWFLFSFGDAEMDTEAMDRAMEKNAMVMLALLPELDKVVWECQRSTGGGAEGRRTYMTETDANLWLNAVAAGERDIRAYGDSAESLHTLMTLLRDSGIWVTREPFTDILGYDGIKVTAFCYSGSWSHRTYYAETERGLTPVATSFGWGDSEDYPVDLDGDGTAELVCLVTYGGDGARRVTVYRRQGDDIYEGWLDPKELPGHSDWGVNSTWEEYDPEEKVFRVYYDKGDGEDAGLWETRGMEDIAFALYKPF